MARRISNFPHRAAAGLVLLGWLLAGGCAGPKRLPPVAGQVSSPLSVNMPLPALLGIGLVESSPSVTLLTGGAAVLMDGGSGAELVRLADSGMPVLATCTGSLVRWQAAGVTGTAASIRLRAMDPDHFLRWGDRTWHGDLLVIPSPLSPGVTLINNVELEAYLQGVLPWEIGRPGKAALAALEAQAVAARTYTVSHLDERRDRGFDLFADVMDQVYKGATEEDPLCNQAIRHTRHLVLEDKEGRLAETYYSACCGGISSRIEKVWARPPQPYLTDHPDVMQAGREPFCAGYKYYNWRETWTVGQLTAILQKSLPAFFDAYCSGMHAKWAGPIFSPRHGGADPHQPGALLDLEILDRTPSGRVSTLAVTTTAGTYHVRGDRVRWVLAPSGTGGGILRSALFDLEVARDQDGITAVTARGKGYGHGIGLCQAGALVMAKEGFTFDEILAHYYPGTRLVRLPVPDLP